MRSSHKSIRHVLLIGILSLFFGMGFAPVLLQAQETPSGDENVPVQISGSEEEETPQESEEVQAPTAPEAEQPVDENGQPADAKNSKKKSSAKKQAAAPQAAQTMSAAAPDNPAAEVPKYQPAPVPDALVFTGSAGYKVPIAVPPGRNGLAPSLALTYNSYRGLSWVGMGWDLNLGCIRRSTKRSVDYNADDFVADSNGSSEELISAVSWGANYYRAKIEEGFTKYFRNGTDGWTATAKDGTKYYYGRSDSSRQGKDANNIYKWSLDKIEDTNGNYLEITYINDQGELYPNEIKYTGHSSGLLPAHRIKFVLEDRDDVRISYAIESKVVTAKRLKTIETYAGSALARKYVIDYIYGATTNRSLVSSITQYGSDNTTALPATLFQYQNGGAPETYSDPLIQDGISLLASMADINGDGLSDLVSINASNKMLPFANDELNVSYRLSLGNGQFEPVVNKIMILSNVSSGNFNTPNPFYGNYSGNVWGPSNTDPKFNLQTRIGDINGDGKMDVIIGGYMSATCSGFNKCEPQTPRIAVLIGIGNGDFNPPILIDGISPLTDLADVNGDGLADMVSYGANNQMRPYGNDELKVSYRLSLGDGQFGPIVNKTMILSNVSSGAHNTPNPFYGNYSGNVWGPSNTDPKFNLQTRIGDINGDGKMDVVIGGYMSATCSSFNECEPQTPRIAVLIGIGNGDFNPPILIDGISPLTDLADVNGDGLADMVSYGANNQMRPYGNDELKVSYRLSLGDGQFGPIVNKTVILSNVSSGNFNTPNPFYGNYSGNIWGPSNTDPKFNLQTRIGDINGDGKMDVVIGGYMSATCSGFNECEPDTPRIISLLSAGLTPDLLSSVQNGYGGSSSLTYVPSSSYQNGLLPFVLQTVASVTVNDGLGNQAVSSYTYQGGFYDFSEREFRGFAQTKKTNPDLTTETTLFHQNKEFQGRAFQVEFRDPGANLLSKTALAWGMDVLSSGVTFVKLNQKRSESYDSQEVFTEENHTYDNSNGNLLSTVASGTGAPAVTREFQCQDYGNWTWRKTIETLKNELGVTLRKTTDDWQPVTGNLLSKSAWLQNGDSPVIRYEYDAYGNVTKEFDAKGNPPTQVTYEQTYTYPEYIYNPLGHTVKFVVDPRYGLAVQKIDVSNSNNTISYTYDPFGRATLIQNPDGGSKEIFYSDVSDINAFPRYVLTKVRETATSFIPAYTFFDGFGRSIQTSTLGEDNKNIISRTYYDNMGRTALNEGPFFASGFAYPQAHPGQYPYVLTEYDYRGRPVAIKSPHGDYPGEFITTSFAYSGFNTTVTDPDGNRKTEKKDYLGRIIEVIEYPHDNEEYHTSYQYNAAGDLLKVTDALNNQTILVYDTLGRKKAMTDPDMGHWTYEYDKNNNLIKQTDAKGQVFKFEYDPLNRVLNKKYYDQSDQPLPNNSPVINTYDNQTTGANGIGKPYTVTKGNVVLTNNQYDSMGRNLKVTKRIDTIDYVTQNEYDLSGKVKKLVYPDNAFITYDYYPGTNLIQTIADSNNVVQAVYTDYEPTGKIGQIDYHNGTATKYTYDAWSTKLFGIVTEDPTRDPLKNLQNREYTYSRAGDILRIVDHVQKVTYDYAYDKLHRLIAEQLTGANAPVATRVETITLNYTGTGPVHGVKTIDLNGVSRTCVYDANGNMVVSPDFTIPTNPLDRAITYDGDNMPTRIVHANGATVDFVYDGASKRTKKLVQSGKTVLYLGDHFEVENGVHIKYIFGGNLRLAQIKGSLTSYFHKDHLGSTAAVTNEAGVKIESTTYEPFGSTRTQEGTAISNYKFTDQELDNETGLYNYDARLYDPVLGMFVTPDSIVPRMYDPQSLNRFAYCRNNPLIYTDPTGHVHWGAIGKDLLGVGLGSLQCLGGVAIATATGVSVVGAVAGTVVAVQGAVTAGVSFGNLINDLTGTKSVVSNSGVVGAVTSIVTDDQNKVAVATTVDAAINLAAGMVAASNTAPQPKMGSSFNFEDPSSGYNYPDWANTPVTPAKTPSSLLGEYNTVPGIVVVGATAASSAINIKAAIDLNKNNNTGTNMGNGGSLGVRSRDYSRDWNSGV